MSKITIATGSFWPEIGGPSSYLKSILPKLMESGFSIDLVTRSKKGKYPEDAGFSAKDARLPDGQGSAAGGKLKIYRLKDLPGKPLNYLRFFLKLLKTARSSNLIYAQGAVSSGYPAYWANKLLKKKFVVKITGDYAWESRFAKANRDSSMAKPSGQYLISDSEIIDVLDFQNKKLTGKFNTLRKIQMKVCQTADKVIVPSKFLAKVVGNWGVKENNIKVIYNGIDFKSLGMEKEKARREIGISGNIILSVGRLVPWKGFKMLIKIMPELLKEYQFARLIIVGDGPEMESLETMKNNMGLNNKVYLVGKKSQEDLKMYLAAADIFVLNTAYEGFSHQLLEAMAAGVPIVTTNAGGNPELIKQGENGFMVKYNDEFNLVEAIKAVFNNKDIREKFIEEGKKTAQKFTVQKMADETAQIFNSLF
ncbi:MAG: phosphatidylinositol alpha-mannosyltransferase [Parcubacteria group bacterium Gr01-1014_2]|nr:MAG: phosphatidylinositol alpha-mannosyltransferase [Parcubacteria group bacterium Gr01-1014_2]